jgi:hypothetical protein
VRAGKESQHTTWYLAVAQAMLWFPLLLLVLALLMYNPALLAHPLPPLRTTTLNKAGGLQAAPRQARPSLKVCPPTDARLSTHTSVAAL